LSFLPETGERIGYAAQEYAEINAVMAQGVAESPEFAYDIGHESPLLLFLTG
jgi:hypothetical protein